MSKVTRRDFLAAGTAVVATSSLASERVPFRDRNVPLNDRVQDLLSRMTLDEKVAQLCCLWMTKSRIVDVDSADFSPEKAAKAIPHGIGQIARPSDHAGTQRFGAEPFREPENAVAFMNSVQRWSVEKTRLGIPVLFHEETAHGLAVKGATSFPVPPALGSTWDPALVERVFTVVARQARNRGITVGLSPVVDLLRDPRWGRSEEFFGEDPFLVSQMGAAAVRGLQGTTRPIAPERIFATLKHFVHGTPLGGINTAPFDVSERLLREVYLPAFSGAISNGAAIVMPSYNEVAGVPAHANEGLLQQTGRQLLAFNGAFFSDYAGIDQLAFVHRVAADPLEAALLAMRAGVDVDLPEGNCYRKLGDLVTGGRLPMERLDAAVSRVLALKFEAGLFENPYVNARRAARTLNDPLAAKLAREAAAKALVLLKNDGILPLDAERPLKMALIGPNSIVARLGGYSGQPARSIGLLEGLQTLKLPSVTIEHADGVWLNQSQYGVRPEVGKIVAVPPAENAQRIAEAIELARRSDVIVLALGDTEQLTREAVALTLPGDRKALGLFGDQDRLVTALLETGKPVIALLINGRPLAVTALAERANALVECWYLGEQGGHAMADMLFGRINPGGKLPVTIPGDVGELPSYYNGHPSADRYPYIEGKRGALFPFGHGESFTSFELSAPKLERTEIQAGDPFAVNVEVSNTGKRAGDEVVQLYIRDRVSSVPRPVMELKAFQRITLEPGEKRTVRFALAPDVLAFWDAEMRWSIEEGAFTIYTGNSSASLKQTVLTVKSKLA